MGSLFLLGPKNDYNFYWGGRRKVGVFGMVEGFI